MSKIILLKLFVISTVYMKWIRILALDFVLSFEDFLYIFIIKTYKWLSRWMVIDADSLTSDTVLLFSQSWLIFLDLREWSQQANLKDTRSNPTNRCNTENLCWNDSIIRREMTSDLYINIYLYLYTYTFIYMIE